MVRLVIKNGYLKGGSEKSASHLSHLVKYIATRNGVEKVSDAKRLWRSTKKQKNLISQILREFPDAKESLEYEDYCDNPNRENASEFITIALEQHMDKIGDREKYLDYIANRPRVERIDSHGLFNTGNIPLVLSQVAKEVSEHTGNVWTPIISLRREDAAAFAFDNSASWKAMLSSKALEIAKSLKIQPDHFKWYAAFHNESHHPHVHMICYSTYPTEGYLTKDGIKNMKSVLANEIFKQELIPLYAEKTQQRDALKKESAKTLRECILQMQGGTFVNDKIADLMTHLADRQQYTTGKKQYGYLKADLKNVVDEIIDELARDERIADAYHSWLIIKNRIDSVYSEREHGQLPLSQCTEFKSMKNLVIKEALTLQSGGITFEESEVREQVLSEPTEEDADTPQAAVLEESISDDEPMREYSGNNLQGRQRNKNPSWWTDEYKLAKQYLHGDEDADIVQDFEAAQEKFLREANKNNPLAMCDLGRMYATGLGCDVEEEKSYGWYAKGLAVFHAAEKKKSWKYIEYRIGKMYAAGLGTEQDYEKAAHWLTLSANEEYNVRSANKFAEYSLGGLYYRGNGVEQSYETAFDLYLCSADQGFPYASFELGKMLRDGIGCSKDINESQKHFTDAFVGFTELEQKSQDDKLQYRLGWMLLNGVGTKKDIHAAKSYFEKAATVGNSFACYQLAKIILSDEAAIPPEVAKALEYMHQAVKAENPYAQYFLAKLFEKGQHVTRNVGEAIRLYQLSVQQENEPYNPISGLASYRLGKIYLDGEAVPRDISLALHWLNFSAEKKNQYAEYTLGKLYLKGEIVTKDIGRAIEFLKRSAMQENQLCNPICGLALYQLGKIYLTGKDIPKDVETALRYLNAAAEQGSQYAEYTLGKLYLMGKEVPKDKEAAIQWFTRSAAQGNVYAQFFLEHMDDFKEPSVMLAASRLLHHISRIFEDNMPPVKPQGHQTDRKLLQKIRAKKQAQGHAKDDQEQTMSL